MSLADLKQHIKDKTPARLYYLYGVEEYLKRFYYNELRSMFCDMEEFNVLEPSGEKLSVSELADLVDRYPMMQDSKFVGVIDLSHQLLTESYKKQLLSVLSDIPDFTTLVFMDTALKGEKDAVLERLVQKAGGLCVAMEPPSVASLAAWSRRHFKGHGKVISDDTLRYFLERVENDMMTLGGEIEKVAAYTTAEEVTRADIDAVTTRSLTSNRFLISDALVRRDFKTMLSVLEDLYAQNLEPIIIANLMYRAICDLLRAKWAIDAGKGQAEVAKDFKIAPFGVGKMMRAVRGMRVEYLHTALEIVMDFEWKFKRESVDTKTLLYATVGALAALKA